MNKLFERHPTRETVKHLPETHDDLPELPADVTVPEDISGLHAPTRLHRSTSGVRWMRWLAVIPLVAGAIAVALIVRSDGSDTKVGEIIPSPNVVEGLDGYAIAEANRMETLRDLSAVPALDGYAIAEANRMETLRDLSAVPALDGYAIAEANRMETLRDLSAVPALDGYAIAEANRMETLRDLSAVPALDGYAIAEANRMETLRDLSAVPALDGYAIAGSQPDGNAA